MEMNLHGRRLDAAAVTLSAACAIHCLILPLAASALPLLGSLADADWVHWVFVALAAPITVLALRARGTPRPIQALAAIGLAGLAFGALQLPSDAWATPLTVGGGVLLAIAHLLNAARRLGKRIPRPTGSSPVRAP